MSTLMASGKANVPTTATAVRGAAVIRVTGGTHPTKQDVGVAVGAGPSSRSACDDLVPDRRSPGSIDDLLSATNGSVADVPPPPAVTKLRALARRAAASASIIDAVVAITASAIVAAALLLIVDGALMMTSEPEIYARPDPVLEPTGLPPKGAASVGRP